MPVRPKHSELLSLVVAGLVGRGDADQPGDHKAPLRVGANPLLSLFTPARSLQIA
jgi:hypothetical protein